MEVQKTTEGQPKFGPGDILISPERVPFFVKDIKGSDYEMIEMVMEASSGLSSSHAQIVDPIPSIFMSIAEVDSTFTLAED